MADLRAWLRRNVSAVTAVVCLTVAIAVLVPLWRHNLRYVREFQFDDTFITLRYAAHLARHGHLSWNLDDRIDGYTSPGWTVLMALAMALGFDGEHAAYHGAYVSGIVGALAAVLLARKLGAHWAVAIAIAGVGTVSMPGYVVWTAPGMETPFAAAAATLALLAFALPAEGAGASARIAPWLRATASVVCATARPDGIALVGPLLLGEAVLVARTHRDAGRGSVLRTLRPYIIAVGVLGVLFVVHWGYYGYPLGNTYYAKRGSAILAARGMDDLLDFLRDTTLWLGPLAAAGLALTRPSPRRVSVLVGYTVWFVATCVTYARAGGDYTGFYRFYQPLVPGSYAVIAASLAGRWEDEGAWPPWRHAVALGLAITAGLYLHLASDPILAVAWERDYGQIRHAGTFAASWRRVGEFLRRTYPPGTTMAIRAAGIIPYLTDFHCYDVLGLNNPAVAHGPITAEYPGHQREATPREIVASHQDIIVMHPQITPADLSDHPEGPLAQPEFAAAGYVFRCLRMDPGEYLCLWERPGVHRNSVEGVGPGVRTRPGPGG